MAAHRMATRGGAARLFRFALVLCLAWWNLATGAAHAEGLPLIRDSEIEGTLRAWSDPLFKAAGLNPASIRVLIVKDDSLNAFVAGGQNLFINTGLLTTAKSPGQIIGVIAHETGHIAGGHLARSSGAINDAQNLGLFATLLGIGLVALGAAAGANTGAAGGAAIIGGQSMGMRNFLAYTRAQESAADQAALTYLDRTKESARGMLDFLNILADQDLLASSRQDPYVRSHPLTQDRIELIAEHVRTSRWPNDTASPEDTERYQRMRAKLIGFLDRPQRVLRTYYPETDTSLAARYARAVAYERLPDLPKALAAIDSLIAERPDDPYFQELKGQILFENGKAGEAVPFYRAAARLRPEDGLIQTGLGQAMIESGDPSYLPDAVQALETARRADRENPSTWRLLAIAYHNLGQDGPSTLAAGEYALLIGQPQDARLHAGRAQRSFPEGSPGWLRAQDIKAEADQLEALADRAGRG